MQALPCYAQPQYRISRRKAFPGLRHIFATLPLQNSDDIKTVSESLGHATVAFTLDVYGHVPSR